MALNKISGEWDDLLLTDLMSELKTMGFDTELTGFSMDEIEKLFNDNDKSEVKEDDFDADKAVSEPPFTMLGNLWTLGRHSLLVGDSTKAEDVARLMNGNRANCCITDPPYNCNITGGSGLKILNDNMSKEQFYNFLFAAFKNIYENLVEGGAFYCFHSDAEKVNFYNACVNAGFHYSTTCIWVKDSLVLGRQDYQMRHEPVLYSWKPGEAHKWLSDRKQTTVWDFPRPKKSELHPTMKSIDLIAYPLKNSTAPNSIVVDLFGGSGSTLICCGQLDRICFTTELDPKYAGVIVKRYIKQVGKADAVIVEAI
ncbi:methyltransferase [Clostridia bacterium]|nr:methyltransferase [Clostridia bacterium]